MNRRGLLGCGAALLSVALAGCTGSPLTSDETRTTHSTAAGANTTGSPTATATATRGTTTGTPTTTIPTGENHESYLLQNLGSETRKLTVTVTPQSGEQKPLVDATYEIPGKYVLTFPTLLEHGQRYRLEATGPTGASETTTITVEGCSDSQYAPGGDRDYITSVGDDDVGHGSLPCDVVLRNEFTISWPDEYKVSN
ncbi:hypothetical protein [Halomicrococcus gelatinilyticus]|uniref:hypothetical protein n=1 Tax=Halomicrococcus gelatinilyticus TaxID=1702103 RepID=UPI002E1453A5